MKKSVMSVEAMVEMYLNYGLEEETWNMMWNMAVHGLISHDNWVKFFEKCKSWTFDDSRNNIVDGITGEVLYTYDENGNLKKVA